MTDFGDPFMSSTTHNAEDYDLPRWQTQSSAIQDQSYLANSPAAAQYSSLYNTAPPPPPQTHLTDQATIAQRLPPINVSSPPSSQPQSASSRQQPRISQLLDLEQQSSHHLSPNQHSIASLMPGVRNSSLPGEVAIAGSRPRQNDDLERAYPSEPQSGSQRSSKTTSNGEPLAQSFYPPTVAYASSTNVLPSHGSVSSNAGDVYQDMYYQSPRRTQTQRTSPSAANSPRRSNTITHHSQQSQNTDAYPQQSSGLYQSQGSYTSPYSDPQSQYSQYRDTSKPSSPYSSHLQSQSATRTSQYSPSYGTPMDTQTSSRNTSQTPLAHTYSLSQSQSAQHLTSPPSFRQQPQQSLSNPTSPQNYAPQESRQYFQPTVKDEPMADALPSAASLVRRESERDVRNDPYYSTRTVKSEAMDVVPKGRPTGLRRVRDSRDLRPYINTQPAGRRADPNNPTNFLSPLLSLTTHIQSTYSLCNPQFKYESSHNPRRVLTKPSKPAHNDGYDNEDYDYILYVNDWLGTDEGHKYLILDILGQGTFGQVVKCQNMKTHEVVAVKVVKNKPAYYNQSLMEVTILQLLNNQHDPRDEHHILRMRDHFVHKSHLCLVFELLSQNLYELIKQNQFQGLSTQLVKVFTSQLLDALSVLKSARLIHCDLKPENILLKSLSTPGIKVIDFGSACHEKQTVYTYIQSRFYRSPEVLLGVSYSAAIDMWSLGCIAVELFLGLPLFPGTSEYNQITRIVEMLGLPPAHMLEHGKQTSQFFDSYIDGYGQKQYKLKSIEQYSREHNVQEQPGKQYFKANTLPEIINMAPMPPSRSSSSQARPSSTEIEREANNRAAFTDFCLGLLNLNPMERWTPQQARNHPFITGEKFVKRFQPYSTLPEVPPPAPALTLSSSSSADAKRPYGGLVQSQPKGSRAYQDAAAYNHQLNQHQAYTAQAQAAQAASNAFRNPYIAQVSAPQQSANSYPARDDRDGYSATQQQTQQPVQQYNQSTLHTQNAQPSGTSSIDHRLSQSTSGSLNNALSYSTSTSSQHGLQQSANPNPPSSSYYPNARARANTINQMDVIPPALMRLQQMGMDLSGVGRNALTPVMNRDDAVKEWERRAQGKAQPAQPYPQLEYLQQQAELASSGGWSQGNAAAPSRYPPPPTLQQYQTPVQLLVDNHDRRRDSTRAQRSDYLPTAMPAPPQASYTGSEAGHNSVYAPIQSNQYGLSSSRTHAQSFYPPGVVAAGQSHQSYGTDQSGSQNASSSRDSGVSGSMDWRA